jgi:hypothetical protein
MSCFDQGSMSQTLQKRAFRPEYRPKRECSRSSAGTDARSGIVLAKMLDHLLGRMSGIRHHEMGRGTDRLQPANHAGIEELLAIVTVPLYQLD